MEGKGKVKTYEVTFGFNGGPIHRGREPPRRRSKENPGGGAQMGPIYDWLNFNSYGASMEKCPGGN